ncbi:MAG: STAS domain-containing protein [Lachnospiraceae bacterium]|nr:STAS domain-containing protein [Lachnospiraceae bacterium]
MENIAYSVSNDTLNLQLKGRIDSANSGEVDKVLEKVFAENAFSSVVIDCKDLQYISSAGLRVILRIKKKKSNTVITEVNSAVYEIFSMTGFTEMIEIHKAFRVINVEGCEVIGQGANGKVFRIDRDTIVKQYLNPEALEDIRKERELARTAFILGVPTAISYDVVKIKGGGFGSVFELLDAGSLAKQLISGKMSVDQIVECSVSLLKTIHSTIVKPDSMPDMKAVALNWADFLKDYLPEEHAKKLHDLVAAVPEDNRMLHGDYHLKNVMYVNGESILIDMDTLCHGHPVFEFASMFNAYRGFHELDPENAAEFLGIDYNTEGEIWEKSLRLYFDGVDDTAIREIEKKAMIIGYTRLMRRLIRRNGFETETGRKQIECYKKHLEELLPQVDTLVF